MDLAVMQTMEKALHKCGPLQGKGCDEEVKSHTAESITLEKCHQKPEAHKDHHMHILET